MNKASQCPHIQLLDADLFLNGPPREQYRELRQNQPVCWLDDPYTDSGYWAVTKQAEVDIVSKNAKLFSSEVRLPYLNETAPDQLEMQRKNLLCMDPPRHIKYRRIVRSAFTPTMVDSYRPRFEQRAHSLVEKALAGGRCEFVADIAAELPLMAICEILGVPQEDRRQFFEWSNTLIGGDDPEYSHGLDAQINATTALYSYADQLAERYQDDAPAHNLVYTLLHSNVEGEQLSIDEFHAFMMLLIVAGNETTRNQTSQLMRLLIEHPAQYQMLVDDPSLIPDAVEEGLRYCSPVIAFRRTATADTELGGQQIAKDDKIVMFYQSASADETHFEQPDIFDITRPQREAVAGEARPFGYGEHFCLGTHLARLELRVTMAAVVERIRQPRFDGSVEWLRSHFINGIKRMPIAFDIA